MSPDIIHATGDLFPKVSGVDSSGGVAMNAPPANHLAEISNMVTNAMASMPIDGRGQFVGIAHEINGVKSVNLALAVRVVNGVEIVGWIGKSWGTPIKAAVLERGVGGRWTF